MINLSEERILDFLDGRLATPDEEELLHTLAVSPERRQLMREHMKLRELTSTIARQDRFSVPERVTSQLFNKLEEAGFTPPVTPESLMLRAPAEGMSMKYAGAAALGAGTVATGLSSAWRFGAISLLAASVMSFVLGAGAYYVFGSELGLRTHSQEMAALQHSMQHRVTPGLASQYAAMQNTVAAASPDAGNASGAIAKHTAGNAIAGNNTTVASIFPIVPTQKVGIGQKNASMLPTVGSSGLAENDNTAPIGYTVPKQHSYTLATDEMHLLNGAEPILPNVIPTPLANERGTISVRGGVGQAFSSTSSNMSSLNELRFGMTKWDYVLFRASMGRMTSFERTAQISTSGSTKGEIITPESSTPTTTMMVGLETGVTLDPLGVPIDALVGFMWSGGGSTYQDGSEEYSPFYGRASIMAHFEPWHMLEISAGFEGLLYTHYLGGAIAQQEHFYSLSSSAGPKGNPSEMSGLVGPALEFGWHF
jgi:hypothetical protein